MGAISLLYPLYFGKRSLWKDRVSNILWSVVFPYKVLHQSLCNTSLKAAFLGPSKDLLQDLKRCECPGQWPHLLSRKALDTGQWDLVFQEGFRDLSGPMWTWIPGERGPPLRGERDWIPPPGRGDRDWIPPRSVANMVPHGAPPQGRHHPPPNPRPSYLSSVLNFFFFSFYIYL